MLRLTVHCVGEFFYRLLSTERHLDTGEISSNAGPFDVRM